MENKILLNLIHNSYLFADRNINKRDKLRHMPEIVNSLLGQIMFNKNFKRRKK